MMNNQTQYFTNRLNQSSSMFVGLLFTYCAELLLPLYETFSKKNNYGNLPDLKNVLDKLWNAPLAGPSMDYLGDSDKVNQQIPDIDKFDNLEATFAQDFCICLDAAILAYSNNREESLIEYFFEPLRLAVCHKKYGVLDVGSDLESEFEDYFSKSELLNAATSQLNKLFDSYETQVNFNENLIKTLRRNAIESSWSIDMLK